MRTSRLVVASLFVMGLGCSSTPSDSGTGAGGAGTSSKGGSSGSAKGGSDGSGSGGSAVGNPGSGGNNNGGGGSGGGESGTGGTTSAGGGSGTGSGGTTGTGGTDATGGAPGSGGAMGTGGSPGKGGATGSGDAGADAPTTPPAAGASCTDAKASFCDDFEAQTMGAAPKGMFTTKIGGGAAFTVDTSKAYSGTKSAHIHVPMGSGGNNDPTAQMTFMSQFPIAMNDLHGRAMVFLTKNPNSTGKPNIHWDLFSANGGGKTYTLGSMYNGVAKAGAFMPVYQPGDSSIDTSTPFPEGRWACIQWEFKYAGGAGDQLVIKMDGKNIDLGKSTAEGGAITGNHIAAWPAGAWTRLTFGYVHFSSPTPIDVDLWFDDLAFGPQEIGCPAMK